MGFRVNRKKWEICSVGGCERLCLARSLCSRHYTPRTKEERVRKPMSERIKEYCVPVTESGCWIWFGSTSKYGYGYLRNDESKRISAHRASYESYKGPIPEGLVVRHSCDTKCCVNPDHLSVGTNKDNVNDMMIRGRGPVGSKNPFAKLTEDQAVAIISDERPSKEIAKEYGVHESNIYGIKSGRFWKQIPRKPK